MTRLAAPLLLSVLCGGGAVAEEWAEADTSSAKLAYSDLDLIGSSSVMGPDGGLRIVTFWARSDRASAEHSELSFDAESDPKAVTRCITDLGPDQKVIRDRCWQTRR